MVLSRFRSMSTNAIKPPLFPGMRITSLIRRGVKPLPAPIMVIWIGRWKTPGNARVSADLVCSVWPSDFLAVGFFMGGMESPTSVGPRGAHVQNPYLAVAFFVI